MGLNQTLSLPHARDSRRPHASQLRHFIQGWVLALPVHNIVLKNLAELVYTHRASPADFSQVGSMVRIN
jgi:hypothetical protein